MDGIADGWLKADGEQIYKATDLRVGLAKQLPLLPMTDGSVGHWCKPPPQRGQSRGTA